MFNARIINDNCYLKGNVIDNDVDIIKVSTGQLLGVGIDHIELLSTDGLIDTYRITYTNGTTYDYIIKNGSIGPQGPKGDKGDTGESGELTPEQLDMIIDAASKKVTLYDDTEIKKDISDLKVEVGNASLLLSLI